MLGRDQVLQRFFQLTVVMSDAMDEDLARRGLTRPRATLMAHLHDQGPTIQNVLARALRVSPRNVTGLVNGLEASGLATRSPHPSDRRATLVGLTEDGFRAAAALADAQRELARYLFANHTSGELKTLTIAFDRLLDRLDDPAFETLRQSALQRWPLATTTGQPHASERPAAGPTTRRLT
jgi:DNA-binding MarR family transcriptional regulator